MSGSKKRFSQRNAPATRPVGKPPRQSPYKRVYESGRVVWVARFIDPEGKTRYAKPRWHGAKATFSLKRDAQRAIDEALERQCGAPKPDRLDAYLQTWVKRHPRATPTESPRRLKSRSTGAPRGVGVR